MFKWLMLRVYILLSTYILWRMIHWFKIVTPLFRYKRAQAVWIELFVLMDSTLFWGVFLPHSAFQTVIRKVSNVWLAFFIFVLTFIIFADIIVLVLKCIHRRHAIGVLKKRWCALLLGVGVGVYSLGFTIYGSIHARHITTQSYDVTVQKQVDGINTLNMVLVADLHMGYSIGCKEIQHMADQINAMQPDIVLYAGDIFDNDYDALDDDQVLIKILKGIKATYGSYAVYGNHDVTEKLVGGFSTSTLSHAFRDVRMEKFLDAANIHVLTDDVLSVADGQIQIIGRLDGEKAGDGTKNRAALSTLIAECEQSKPIVLLNHEPNGLQEAADEGVDLMLCGHTHAGQFFPLTIVQPLAWENYWGIKKIDNMYSIVTSGIGVYGPAVRVGTNSEVMQIKVHFE